MGRRRLPARPPALDYGSQNCTRTGRLAVALRCNNVSFTFKFAGLPKSGRGITRARWRPAPLPVRTVLCWLFSASAPFVSTRLTAFFTERPQVCHGRR